MDCNVDIISMSWTIESRTPESEDMRALYAAIHRAAAQNILMFCSASDQGGSTEDASYPGEWGPCVKIGGSTVLGDRLTWVNEKNVHFLLPGKRIPFEDPDGKTFSYESGSSLATACASGLAGALLYCDRILGRTNELREGNNIKTAFRGLTHGNNQLFPNVQKNFDERFKEYYLKAQANKAKKASSVDIPTLEWNNDTKTALSELMSLIKVSVEPVYASQG